MVVWDGLVEVWGVLGVSMDPNSHGTIGKVSTRIVI